MMISWKPITRFVYVLLLSGCMLVSVFPVMSAAPTSTTELWEKGKGYFQRGMEKNDEVALKKAEGLLGEALAAMPDNVNLQIDYYRLLFTMVREELLEMECLRRQFTTLHPNAKEVVEAPAMINALKAFERRSIFSSESEVSDEDKIKLVQSAIAEQPKSKLAWYILSILYKEQKQYPLALNAAKTGLKIDKDDVDFQYEAGDIYYRMAASDSCIYEKGDLLKKSAVHLAGALGKGPNHNASIYSLNILGAAYNRIGLFPMALEVSWKAYRRMFHPDLGPLNPKSLTDALFYTGKAEDALRLMKKGYEVDLDPFAPKAANGKLPILARTDYYKRYSVVNLMNGKWKLAYTEYLKAMKKKGSPQQVWIGQWIHQIYGQKSPRFVKFLKSEKSFKLGSEVKLNAWAQQIDSFLTDPKVSEVVLLEGAKDVCQKTQAHFYAAMRSWQQGDLSASRANLTHVATLKTFGTQEHMWATALLKSDLFQNDGS